MTGPRSSAAAEIRLNRVMAKGLSFTLPELLAVAQLMAFWGKVSMDTGNPNLGKDQVRLPAELRLQSLNVKLPPQDMQRLLQLAHDLSEPGMQLTQASLIRAFVHTGLNRLESILQETRTGELEAAAELLIAKAGKVHPDTLRRLRRAIRPD